MIALEKSWRYGTVGKWCAFVINFGCCIFLSFSPPPSPLDTIYWGTYSCFQLKKSKKESSGPLLELSRATLSIDSWLSTMNI